MHLHNKIYPECKSSHSEKFSPDPELPALFPDSNIVNTFVSVSIIVYILLLSFFLTSVGAHTCVCYFSHLIALGAHSIHITYAKLPNIKIISFFIYSYAVIYPTNLLLV